jgi:hypothetical protein
VLGFGVQLKPAAFSRCPYLYRVVSGHSDLAIYEVYVCSPGDI